MNLTGTKLRVALVGSYSPDTTLIRGGVRAATAYLVQGLSKIDDLEYHILAMRPSDWAGPDDFAQNGAHIHLLPPYPRFERLRGYRVYQTFVNRALEQIQPAVVHAQEAAAEAFVAIRSGYPTVITVHGIRAEDVKYVRYWPRRLRFYFDSILTERRVIRRAQHLIAISHYVTTYFDPWLRKDIHLEYIPNAVDESFFNLGGDPQRPVVLFVGRLTFQKRVLDLIQAFERVSRQLPQAELRLAGEVASEPAYVETLREYIQHSDLSDRVHILGELRQVDLLREYRDCTLVVLPSAQENAPMVLAQAMAAGKPVVATRVGGVPEMVGQAGERGLLIDVGDQDALAAALSELLLSPARCALLGQAGQTFALENYHPDRVARRTVEVYRKISAVGNQTHG